MRARSMVDFPPIGDEAADEWGTRVVQFGENLLGGAVALDVGFEDGVENVVGRERVGVALAGAEFGGGRLGDGVARG